MAGAAFGKLLKQIAGPALTSGGLTGGLALLGGSSPLNALAYGVADAAASGGSLALLRKLRPNSYRTQTLKDVDTGEVRTIQGTSKLEIPVNLGASIGTGALLSSALEGGNPQSLQIAQQLEQRSVVNQLPLQQELANLSPGTMSQVPGMEFQQLLNQVPRNQWMQYLSPEDQQMLAEVANPRLL
jgi:hypothetical protein